MKEAVVLEMYDALWPVIGFVASLTSQAIYWLNVREVSPLLVGVAVLNLALLTRLIAAEKSRSSH